MVGIATTTATATSTIDSSIEIYYVPGENTTYTTGPGPEVYVRPFSQRTNQKAWIRACNATSDGWTNSVTYPTGYSLESTSSTIMADVTTTWSGGFYDYFPAGAVACGWYDATANVIHTYGPPSAEEQKQIGHNRIREIMNSRQAPAAITSRNRPMPTQADIREQRARETLRRVIGEDKFKNFLKTGFITVKAKSGKVYQIFPSHGITQVYNRGVMVDRLCVVLQGDFPPTDSMIMRYLMILNNEKQFEDKAVKHSVPTPNNRYVPMINNIMSDRQKANGKSLPELFKEIMKVA